MIVQVLTHSVSGRLAWTSHSSRVIPVSTPRRLIFPSLLSAKGFKAAGPSITRWWKVGQRSLSSRRSAGEKMADDDAYMAFLNKANELSEGQRQAMQSGWKAPFKAVDEGSAVPNVLKDVCEKEMYMSEADEPFEAVSLKWEGKGGLPDGVEFAKLIHHWNAEEAAVEVMDPVDWDAHGQYSGVIEAVREATKGNDVRVYRVVRDATRAEYWVLSREQGQIVGVKALAVES